MEEAGATKEGEEAGSQEDGDEATPPGKESSGDAGGLSSAEKRRIEEEM